jgi:hypothetical protein
MRSFTYDRPKVGFEVTLTKVLHRGTLDRYAVKVEMKGHRRPIYLEPGVIRAMVTLLDRPDVIEDEWTEI